MEEETEENPKMTKSERIAMEKRDKELDDLQALRKKLETEEAKGKNVKLMLETQKSLFPPWSIERIQKKAIDNPNIYWLQPSISFDLNNDVESQFDFLITPRVFLFRCFENIKKSLISDSAVNQKLFSFYFKYGKPQYKSWSLKNISAVRVKSPVHTEDFLNIQFKGFRGANHVVDEFTLADLPCMNPYKWISLFNILMKDETKYEPIITHLKRILICYILETARWTLRLNPF